MLKTTGADRDRPALARAEPCDPGTESRRHNPSTCLFACLVAVVALSGRSAMAQSQTDAISREISIYNNLTPAFADNAVSRELSIYNDLSGGIGATPTDASSREVSFFKFQQAITSSRAATAYLVLGALPDQLAELNSGPPPFNPNTWLPVHRKQIDAAAAFVCSQVPDPLQQGFVRSTSYLTNADEVTLDNGDSAFYRFTFSLPAGAAAMHLRGSANCDQQGVLFLNGHRITALMNEPPCQPSGPSDPCYAAQDTGHDRTDGQGRAVLTSPTPDTFDDATLSDFVTGTNELVFAVCGDASYTDPTGVEFSATLEYDLTNVNCTIAPLQNPQNVTLCPGQAATFSVGASSGGTLTYQWRRNGVSLTDGARISGSTENTLLINNVQTGDLGSYDVVVASECDSKTSNAATITLRQPVAITQDPGSVDAVPGVPASFTGAASGDAPLSYRWQKNGVDLVDGGSITGANSPSLVINPVSSTDAGQYRMGVTNACGTQYSQPATLRVVSLSVGRYLVCDAATEATSTHHALRASLGGEFIGAAVSAHHAIHAGFWLSGGNASIRGDLNCDNAMTTADVSAFVLALLDPAAYAVQYPLCDMQRGDLDASGTVDGADIGPFVSCLLGGACP